MKERGYLSYLLIIIHKKHHGIKGASKGGESIGWEVADRDEVREGGGGEGGGDGWRTGTGGGRVEEGFGVVEGFFSVSFWGEKRVWGRELEKQLRVG